jgi:crotonobetainyl-CoA:carnitine CoA-transferase CaiB-like acyl-CoA transferase
MEERPLDGLKVIDMGHVVAGPTAGSILGDWGADVIKVEPIEGEWIRSYRGHMEPDPEIELPDGGRVHWLNELLNRSKRGIALDLKSARGREILLRLVDGADVFLSNHQARVLEKLGLGYEDLAARNPRLVYGMLSGFGPVGPEKDKRGYDQLLWGRSGLSDAVTEPGGNLVVMRPAMADRIAGDQLVMGILAALWWRERSGRGQRVDASLYQAAMWTLALDVQPTALGLACRRFDRRESNNPLANLYRTRDDRWLMLAMIQSAKDWNGFCAAIERPDLRDDARFADGDARRRNCRELIEVLDQVFVMRDLREWEERLRAHDCIFERVQTYAEAIEDPQVLANDFLVETPHPVAGTLEYLGAPVRVGATPSRVSRPGPEIGEHTREVLLEAGYSAAEIDAFVADGVAR